MKRMLFISTLSLLVAASLNAQLRVDSLGNIRVNTTANSNYKFDLMSSTLGFQSTVKNSTLLSTVAVDGSAWHQVTGNAAYGVRGRVYGSWLEGPCYGIYGATNTSSNSQNYGVWGSIAPNVGGLSLVPK